MGEPQQLGRYEILEVIGQGAMGAVYKARDPMMERVVAVKTILGTALSGPMAGEYRERFYREARAAGRFSHPNIVTIYDVGEHENTPYLVMEYIPGRTLDSVLEGGKRFTLEQTCELAKQLAEALDYAHQFGVIHRDIKPANILLTAEGKPKIADFGVAKLTAAQVTTTGQLLGTPAFMAPEQFTGAQIDGRADLFSLGVILYWLATADKPFTGDTIVAVSYKIVHTQPISPRRLNPSISAELERILQRLLEKDPGARYQSGAELARDLAALGGGIPSDAAKSAAMRSAPTAGGGGDPERTTPMLGTRSPGASAGWKDSDITMTGPMVPAAGAAPTGGLETPVKGTAGAPATDSGMRRAGTTMGPRGKKKMSSAMLLGIGAVVILAIVAGSIWMKDRATSEPGTAGDSSAGSAASAPATPPAVPTTPEDALKVAQDAGQAAQLLAERAGKGEGGTAKVGGTAPLTSKIPAPAKVTGPPVLEISAVAPVSLVTRADKQGASTHQLQSGGNLRVEYKDELFLTTTNSTGVKLKLRGKDIPMQGPPGSPVAVRVDAAGLVTVVGMPPAGPMGGMPKALTVAPSSEMLRPNRVLMKIEAVQVPVMADLVVRMGNEIILQRDAGTAPGHLSFVEDRQLPPGRHRFRVMFRHAGTAVGIERNIRGDLRMGEVATLRIEFVPSTDPAKQNLPILNLSFK